MVSIMPKRITLFPQDAILRIATGPQLAWTSL